MKKKSNKVVLSCITEIELVEEDGLVTFKIKNAQGGAISSYRNRDGRKNGKYVVYRKDLPLILNMIRRELGR